MKKTLLFKWAYALLMPLAFMAIIESVMRGSLGGFQYWVQNVGFAPLLINYSCYFALVNLCQFTRRKAPFVLIQVGVCAFVLILSAVTHYKMRLRLEPVLPSDLLLIKPGLAIAAAYVPHLKWLLGGGAGLLLAINAFVRLRFKGKRREGARMPLFLPAACLCALMGLYVTPGMGAYLRTPLGAYYQNNYAIALNAKANGTAFHMLEYVAAVGGRYASPKGYSKAAVEALVKTDNPPAPKTQPNVILILGESMVDITRLEGLTLSKDPIPNIRRFMDACPSGQLTVTTFGGGTLAPEAAVLTGLHADPYLPHRFDSIPWRLKPLGYRATAVHTYWGWFYDRNKHMKDLGFDRFIPLEAMTGNPVFAPYPEDPLLYEQVLDVIKASDEPDFIYAATMQTHGGYAYDPIYDQPLNTTPLPGDAQVELNNYIALQTAADKALKDFMDALGEFSEPTVVIYFGDHYPSMPLTLKALGYDIEQKNPLLYQTPYFVWSNLAVDMVGGDMLDRELTARVLDALSLPKTVYQRAFSNQESLDMLVYDALIGQNHAFGALGLPQKDAAYLLGTSPRMGLAELSGDNVLTLYGRGLTWRTVIEVGSARALTLFHLDDGVATATLDKDLANALRAAQAGILHFVDDTEKPFASLSFDVELTADDSVAFEGKQALPDE